MNLLKIPVTGHLPADLVERIGALNTEAGNVETGQTALADRVKELADPATVTADNAAARLKAIAATRAARLALLATSRRLTVEALALLAEVHAADGAERARLAEASRTRQAAIRAGLVNLGIADELQVKRAFFQDKELRTLQGAALQTGQTHGARVTAFEAALAAIDAEMVKLLV